MNPSIRINILANLAGKAWSALMGLAFVPLYIEYMGIESFGLVGFFVTLVGVTTILDMGLTTTLNRELARLSALPDAAAEMRTLLHTLEIIYWGIAILTGAMRRTRAARAGPVGRPRWFRGRRRRWPGRSRFRGGSPRRRPSSPTAA